MYALDTNAILYYLKDDGHSVSVLRQVFAQNTPIYISTITELELFAFANLTAREESLIEDLLATVSIIAVDSRIARLAALARKSYGLKVPDSVIAATAMFTGSTLITRNTRDFRRVQNLAVLKI
ncbi:MAG: type II toxin-antitoxin system VapC family toxin [Candidatus Binatia bacterium]